MLAARPPLGWNSWNTFGAHISDQLIRETADAMVALGYRDAGYEYLVIDDCWSLRDRDEKGHIVPDPEKFPYGMKAVADYVHEKGLKFGMYSCAGLRTCAGFPSSYDHEFEDAKDFADWGVDFLKYDFCFFPTSGDCKSRYQTMSMALKASGREILFSACNWGVQDCWDWMGSVGAHMYRSTGDINDNFVSFTDIAKSQFQHFNASGPGCFNDMDMLTIGMYGKGNVGFGTACTFEEYKTQFGLWCFFGAPLMLGGDIRALDSECRALVQNPLLLALDQDEEARQPLLFNTERSVHKFFRHLSGGKFALGLFNLSDSRQACEAAFADCGLPYGSGWGLHLTDLFTGEDLGVRHDDFFADMDPHTCRILGAELARL